MIHEKLKDMLSTIMLRQLPEKKVALLLSGGVDSASMLFMLLELGYEVTAYTFHMKRVESTDLQRALRLAYHLKIDLNTIALSDNIDHLVLDIRTLKDSYYGMETKTDFECFWPVWTSVRQIEEKQIVTGLASDGHFGLSKKAMIHYKENPQLFKEARLKAFSSKRYAQLNLCEQLEIQEEKIICSPYRSMAVAEYLAEFNWYELNKPRQKEPIIAMYEEEFKKFGNPKHVNLQCGDSGIQDHFHRLVSHPVNKRGLKTSIGVINQIDSHAI